MYHLEFWLLLVQAAPYLQQLSTINCLFSSKVNIVKRVYTLRKVYPFQ